MPRVTHERMRRLSDVGPRRKDRDCVTRSEDGDRRDPAFVPGERRRMPDVGPVRRPTIITLARLP
jgi:hypothetical protein